MPLDVFVFQDVELACTDIIRFNGLTAGRDDVFVEILASFGKLFKTVTAHQSRIICDNLVYDIDTWSELDIINLKFGVSSYCPMFNEIMLVGHEKYRSLSLIKWVARE